MHLLFSNFKKQANSFPLGKLFLCSCFYNNMHVLVPAYTTLTKFSPDKDIHKIDRYWSLACYRSIFKVHSKCIYAIILHTTQGSNNTSGHLQTKYWQKKDLKINSISVHFRKNPIFDTVNLLNTKILCIFNVKLSTFPSDHLALCIYDIVNLWWINYRW